MKNDESSRPDVPKSRVQMGVKQTLVYASYLVGSGSQASRNRKGFTSRVEILEDKP